MVYGLLLSRPARFVIEPRRGALRTADERTRPVVLTTPAAWTPGQVVLTADTLTLDLLEASGAPVPVPLDEVESMAFGPESSPRVLRVDARTTVCLIDVARPDEMAAAIAHAIRLRPDAVGLGSRWTLGAGLTGRAGGRR